MNRPLPPAPSASPKVHPARSPKDHVAAAPSPASGTHRSAAAQPGDAPSRSGTRPALAVDSTHSTRFSCSRWLPVLAGRLHLALRAQRATTRPPPNPSDEGDARHTQCSFPPPWRLRPRGPALRLKDRHHTIDTTRTALCFRMVAMWTASQAKAGRESGLRGISSSCNTARGAGPSSAGEARDGPDGSGASWRPAPLVS